MRHRAPLLTRQVSLTRSHDDALAVLGTIFRSRVGLGRCWPSIMLRVGMLSPPFTCRAFVLGASIVTRSVSEGRLSPRVLAEASGPACVQGRWKRSDASSAVTWGSFVLRVLEHREHVVVDIAPRRRPTAWHIRCMNVPPLRENAIWRPSVSYRFAEGARRPRTRIGAKDLVTSSPVGIRSLDAADRALSVERRWGTKVARRHSITRYGRGPPRSSSWPSSRPGLLASHWPAGRRSPGNAGHPASAPLCTTTCWSRTTASP